MSASLVGSEMCIRDRLLGLARSERGSRGPRGAGMRPSRVLPSCQRFSRCLLYTSDAADDM
eukprot:9018147-Alexandrium_andersonii.AAC.1